jgi:diguanylate cyclase (GGDEF)-like protein
MLKDTLFALTGRLRRWLRQAAEPAILFPAIAAFGLIAIWATTLSLIKGERVAAQHNAAASSREFAETYEAQIVRALREIDQALKFVEYAYEVRGEQAVLEKLKSRALLPADMLFVVSIADADGTLVASTRPYPPTSVADQDYFLSQRQAGVFAVGRPVLELSSKEWTLHFSRRLEVDNGTFSGIVIVSVAAAYFVSGYESSTLGDHGTLGILGTDGVFRASRSGETVTAGTTVDYAQVVPASNDEDSEATLSLNVWDGVQRYTSVRQLFDFPLAVIVGLSADEQLAATRRDMQTYLWRAGAGSVLLLAIVAVLSRMSRQLAAIRKRVLQEHIAHAERVEYLAYHDGLTALPNRSLFNKILGQSLALARRQNAQLAVLFLDLDRFKDINDTLGHEAGDELLQEVAVRLKKCLRDSDTVARLGGDEFVVLLHLNEPEYAATVAKKIVAEVARPFFLIGQELRVTASIGISAFPADGLDAQTLTKNADLAMYKAKQEGKNNFQFYSEELNVISLERATLESGLRHALERGEFQLHYQAKREIRGGRITGVEALLRWQHPDLGMVAPMRFIPVAEETGLIIPIGNWVLRTACFQNAEWQHQGLPRLSMAVNLTARQFFDEHLLANLKALLEETGMDAQLLELEINESLLMRSSERALRILKDLKSLGIRIALDDFGVGYVSLSAIKQFPLDTVKIDRSFIRDVATSAGPRDPTGAMIAMGRALSLTVVAVGVETEAQVEFLRRNACDEVQGFYVNKPLPGDQIAELLREQSNTPDSDLPAVA